MGNTNRIAVTLPQLPSLRHWPSNSRETKLTDQSRLLTVYYDGSCPLCAAEIGVYRYSTGAENVAFVDVAAQEDGPIAPGLDKTIALKRFHVLGADGTLASGAEGFGRLWLALPAWRWLGRIVLLPGMLQATEAVYRSFLIFRPVLQWIWRSKSFSWTRR
jgi:predicted DCC family thiol-disulfide oxidoreductase YuxK